VLKIKRSTVNLPSELLNEAISATGLGITETIVRGLELIKKSAAYETAMSMKGKLELNIELDKSRERNRR